VTAKETYHLNKRSRLFEKNQLMYPTAINNPETEGNNNNKESSAFQNSLTKTRIDPNK
jgi:hydroxyacyl-ACP dehydratase HTD2-like protein with hotdog domain